MDRPPGHLPAILSLIERLVRVRPCPVRFGRGTQWRYSSLCYASQCSAYLQRNRARQRRVVQTRHGNGGRWRLLRETEGAPPNPSTVPRGGGAVPRPASCSIRQSATSPSATTTLLGLRTSSLLYTTNSRTCIVSSASTVLCAHAGLLQQQRQSVSDTGLFCYQIASRQSSYLYNSQPTTTDRMPLLFVLPHSLSGHLLRYQATYTFASTEWSIATAANADDLLLSLCI